MTEERKALYRIAERIWGVEAQMLMVGEEAAELAHAVFKWHRAYRKVDRFPAAEKMEQYQEYLELTAKLTKAKRHLVEEAMDVRLMLEQLEILLPAKYERTFKEKYQAFAEKLERAQA